MRAFLCRVKPAIVASETTAAQGKSNQRGQAKACCQSRRRRSRRRMVGSRLCPLAGATPRQDSDRTAYFLRRRTTREESASMLRAVACLGVGEAEAGWWAPGSVSALRAAYYAEAGRPRTVYFLLRLAASAASASRLSVVVVGSGAMKKASSPPPTSAVVKVMKYC